jgi:hypothetical protein
LRGAGVVEIRSMQEKIVDGRGGTRSDCANWCLWLFTTVLALAALLRPSWQGTPLPAAGQAAADRARQAFVDAREHGVSPDNADNTSALQAAIGVARQSGGSKVVLPGGVLNLRGAAGISIPANVSLVGQGRGATVLRVPAGRAAPVLDVDGAQNVQLTDFTLDKAPGKAAGGTAYGISIRGNSADILIERVTIDAMVRGVQVSGAEGSTPGTCRRLTFRGVTCNNSPNNFGFNLDDCDTVLLDDCYGRGNWLDGVKLRRKTFNVSVRGGAFTGNGAGGAGDGIDAYAGGDTFTIDGTVLDDNTANGITVKTGALSRSDPAAYGYVRNARLLNLCCRNNKSIGLYLALSDPLEKGEPLVNGVVVDGGVFEDNLYGIYVAARNTTVNHPLVKRSRRHGIVVASRAFDVEINHPVCVANGQEAVNTFHGLVVAGAQHVVINGGMFLGTDGDAVGIDSDLDAAPVVTRYGVEVATPSDHVIVNWPMGRHLASHTVQNEATGVVLINQDRRGDPEGAAFGSVGSLYRRDYATANDEGYLAWKVKTAGRANAPTGWTWLVQGAPVAALPAPAASLRGLVLSLRGGSGAADGLYQCVKRADDTYAWRPLLRD